MGYLDCSSGRFSGYQKKEYVNIWRKPVEVELRQKL